MDGELELRTNHAGEAQLVEHLSLCGGRPDVPAYVREHLRCARRFEAWSDGVLVGLVAAYVNSGRTAFVTNVSVLQERTREGIASRLLRLCAEQAAAAGMNRLRLDVNCGNLPALRLYEKLGFRAASRSDASVTLEMDIPPAPHSVDPKGTLS